MSTAMADGRRADSDPRRQRVKTALQKAVASGTTVSVSGIARQAGVDRTFLYRHRDLLALIHAAEREPHGSPSSVGLPVSVASLQADLANSHARSTRLITQIRRLERMNAELTARLEERDAELEAARAANRELTRALNQRAESAGRSRTGATRRPVLL